MTTEDALPVAAWADPATGDVISAQRKHAWATSFGEGGAGKAAAYYEPVVRQSDALAALTLVQAERDAMQQERDELRAECDGLFVALAELLSAEQTPMPPAAAGLDAQTAWAERLAAARDNAARTLTPKATQQETRA